MLRVPSVRVALILCAVVAMSDIAITAQSKAWQVPRTAWGDPDFDGIWNYATMTPLERPRDVGDKDVLMPAEAAAYEKRTVDRQSTAYACHEGNARSVEGMLRGARMQDTSPR